MICLPAITFQNDPTKGLGLRWNRGPEGPSVLILKESVRLHRVVTQNFTHSRIIGPRLSCHHGHTHKREYSCLFWQCQMNICQIWEHTPGVTTPSHMNCATQDIHNPLRTTRAPGDTRIEPQASTRAICAINLSMGSQFFTAS